MSGGRWDYGRALEDNQDALRRMTAMNEVMAAIEHEMDWGVSCDTCKECSRLRALAALEQFFDDCFSQSEAAVAIARDHEQNVCPKHQKAPCDTKPQPPTLAELVDTNILNWLADHRIIDGIPGVLENLYTFASSAASSPPNPNYRLGLRNMVLAAMIKEK